MLGVAGQQCCVRFHRALVTSTATETPYLKSKRYYSAFSNFIALILDMLAVFLELNSKRMHLSSEKQKQNS